MNLAALLYKQAERRNRSEDLLNSSRTVEGSIEEDRCYDNLMDSRNALDACLDLLPHGSGIDGDWNESDIDAEDGRLKISVAYHPMDGNGSYDNWRNFIIEVWPGWQGLEIDAHVSEPDVGECDDDIADYLAEVFHGVLSESVKAWSSKEDAHCVSFTT